MIATTTKSVIPEKKDYATVYKEIEKSVKEKATHFEYEAKKEAYRRWWVDTFGEVDIANAADLLEACADVLVDNPTHENAAIYIGGIYAVSKKLQVLNKES